MIIKGIGLKLKGRDADLIYIMYIYIYTYTYTGPDLGQKLDEAGISAAKRPGGAGGEAGGKFRWGEAPSR